MLSSVVHVTALLLLTAELTTCKPGQLDYQKLQEFLAEYEPKIAYEENNKDVVLVLGNTGAGKTTFVQWIAGDDSRLISKQVGEQAGEYVVEDANNERIGHSTIESKTIYPELVIDKDTNTAYYDISGFGDSRGIKHDIATSYFIKRIIEHVNKIKILLVVSYPAVRTGGDRKNFIQLLRHITELIPNSDKYLDGIGLVVTKVDNNVVKQQNGQYQLMSDEAVLANVYAFLRDVAAELNDKNNLQPITPGKKKNYNRAIELINAIVYSDRQRIVLFRRPDEAGPLNKIHLLQEGKQKVKNMVSVTLNFVPVHNSDFSYTVSDETKVKLHSLIDGMEKSLEKKSKILSNNLYEQYAEKLDMIDLKNKKNIKYEDFDKFLLSIRKLGEELKESCNGLILLASFIDNVEHYKELPKLLKNTLSKLNVHVPERVLSDISSDANFLDFIQETLDLKFNMNTSPLKYALLETGKKIQEDNKKVEDMIILFTNEMENKINNDINVAVSALKPMFEKYERDAHDIQELQEKMNTLHNRLLQVQETPDPKEKVQKFNEILISYDIALPEYIIQKIADGKFYETFIKEMQSLSIYLNDSQKWYTFLDEMYNKLTSYEVQNDSAARDRCNVLKQTSSLYNGRKVQDTNIDFVLRYCNSELHGDAYQNIKEVNLNQHKVTWLVEVINITISNDVEQLCDGTKLIVKGRFVKLSDLQLNTCSSVTHLQILATEKVFIDKDLDFMGWSGQVSIMSPVWVVVGNRKITLDGLSGEVVWPETAAEGEDGKPGMPGGPGGNFLGYGNRFINGENLYISANGGNGGSGQNGGNGKPGQDGDVPRIPHGELQYFSLAAERHDNLNYWQRQGYNIRSNGPHGCFIPVVHQCREYTVTGHPCSDGGNGGIGGAGGEGGAAGTIKVFNNAPFTISAVDGKDGVEGSNGSGGKAGSASATIDVSEVRECHLIAKSKYYKETDITYHHCHAGITPCCNKNYSGKLRAPRTNASVDQNVSLAEFRSLLQINLQSTLRKSILSESLQNLKDLLLFSAKKYK